ncbi:hypothetical protein GQ54DRAFT_168917 [Martensiomyces pterosporus]|nr:hypothetical protein GQ54DRAFT_168917 [Martensiomyces pterosporus]
MYSDNSDNSAARAKALIDAAKRQGALEQGAAVELQQAMDSLVEGSLGPGASPNSAEAPLFLISEMLSDTSICLLCECGARTASLALRTALLDSGQQSGETSMHSTQAIDLCLSKMVSLYDELGRHLERVCGSPATTSTPGMSDMLQLAFACTESLCGCLEHMSSGDASIQRSPSIWMSSLEGANPVALYLVKLFEGACRVFAASTNQALRKQPQYTAHCNSLFKVSGRLVDAVSSVLSSNAHLQQDLGMKRSVMERYCEHALAAYKALMGSPQQFKVVWKSLCKIATSFSAASFDNSGLCLKIYLQSCDTVQTLASQTTALFRRTDAADMAAPALLRRTKSSLAFIRFFVFQMSALLAKIRGPDTDAMDRESSPDARPIVDTMAMFDVIFGELMDARTLAHVSLEISTVARQTVSTVVERLAISLFSQSTRPILAYLDSLWAFVSSAKTTRATSSQIPLLEGITRTSANREILRIILANIGSLSPDQQQELVDHDMPVISAFVLAVDRDPVTVFSATKGDSYICDGQQTMAIEYERLVSSASVCAASLASADMFGRWELSSLLIVLQSPPGSLGARVVIDAWLVLAKQLLPHEALTSALSGIVDVLLDCPESLVEVTRSRLSRMFTGFLSNCSEEEQAAFLSDLSTRLSRQDSPADCVRIYSLVPWDICSSPRTHDLVGKGVGQILSKLDRSDLSGDSMHLFSALCAFAPAVKKFALEQEKRAICRHTVDILETCLKKDISSSSSGLQIVDEVLGMAVSFAAEDIELAGSLLGLCVKHIDGSAFRSASAGFLLASLAGCFASADLEQPSLLAAVPQLKQVFQHLVNDNIPWIVRHEAHVQLIRFAMESANSSITETLVPEAMQSSLLSFIQREPAGESVAFGGEMDSIYRSCFDIPMSSYLNVFGDSRKIASSGGGELNSLLAAISALRGELVAASRDDSLTARSARAVQESLMKLSQDIEQFLR